MSDLTKTKEEPESERSNKKLLQSIIVGVTGAFLLPLFLIGIPYWLSNSRINPIEALFLEPFILGIAGFILARILIGGIFGYCAYLILRYKKPVTVISGAFLAGLLGGTIVLFFAIVLSAQ